MVEEINECCFICNEKQLERLYKRGNKFVCSDCIKTLITIVEEHIK